MGWLLCFIKEEYAGVPEDLNVLLPDDTELSAEVVLMGIPIGKPTTKTAQGDLDKWDALLDETACHETTLAKASATVGFAHF